MSRLRAEAPHLAKLIRRVHIKAENLPRLLPSQFKPLMSPHVLDDLHIALPDEDDRLQSEHRTMIRRIAHEIYEGAAHAPGQRRTSKVSSLQRDLEFDALIISALCPPRTQSIIFEAVAVIRRDHKEHTFALRVLKMTLRLFAKRLSDVAIISPLLSAGTRNRINPVSQEEEDYDPILTPFIPTLQSVTTLTLASTTATPDRLSFHSLNAAAARCWQLEPLCTNVTHLSLRNLADKRATFFDFIEGFTALTDLTISDVRMRPDSGTFRARDAAGIYGDPMWMLFLISVRLHRETLRLHLGRLLQWSEPQTLPASAVGWLEKEAVPIGAKVDFARETRLTEDFASLMSLWEADDSERGAQARNPQAYGKLVDEAFGNRWQTFANAR